MVVVLLILLLFQTFRGGMEASQTWNYREFEEAVDSGDVVRTDDLLTTPEAACRLAEVFVRARIEKSMSDDAHPLTPQTSSRVPTQA